MKHFTIYYSGCIEYIADSEGEAKEMFENDHFSGLTMDIHRIFKEEIEEDD